MAFETPPELVPRVGVTLAAEVLQCVGRRDAAKPRAHAVWEAEGQALHEAAAEGVADARRIDDAPRLDGRHFDAPPRREYRAAVFAAGHDEGFGLPEDFRLRQSCLLADELEFVVVAN